MEAGWRCCRGAVLPHTATTPPPAPTLAMVSISTGLRHHRAGLLLLSISHWVTTSPPDWLPVLPCSLMTPSCQPRTRRPTSGQCVAAGPIGWRVYEAAWRIDTSVERGEALVAVPASAAAHWSCDDSYWDRETMGWDLLWHTSDPVQMIPRLQTGTWDRKNIA